MWLTSEEIEVLSLSSSPGCVLSTVQPWTNILIHLYLSFYPVLNSFPKVTVNEQETDQNDICIFLILSTGDIWHEWSGVKVCKAAALVISCSGCPNHLSPWPWNIRWAFSCFQFSVGICFFFLYRRCFWAWQKLHGQVLERYGVNLRKKYIYQNDNS